MLKAALIAIVMLAIVVLIVSAANDYREGKIRIRFDEDASNCEHKDLCVIDEDDNPARICLLCRRVEYLKK